MLTIHTVKSCFFLAIRWLLHWLEDRFSSSPQELGAGCWHDQKFLWQSVPGSEKLVSTSGWRWTQAIPKPGVCTLQKARLWMAFLHGRSTLYESERCWAIIFTQGHQRLNVPGSPYVLSYYLQQGEWWSWWKNRRERVHIDGRVAILGNYTSDCRNYYHFWADTIADIWYLRQVLNETEMPQYYLMAYCNSPWQQQILELCGIQPDQVIPFNQHKRISVENLIVPVRDKGAVALPPWLATAIRSMAGWKGSSRPATRRIFISRSDAPRRRVINEPKFHELLRKRGFEILTIDGLNILEQQVLFSSAEIIFSPHGAALTNIVWCSPGTVVVDFISENHLTPCFKELAWQSGVIYHPVICQVVENESLGIDADIEVTSSQLNSAFGLVERDCLSQGASC